MYVQDRVVHMSRIPHNIPLTTGTYRYIPINVHLPVPITGTLMRQLQRDGTGINLNSLHYNTISVVVRGPRHTSTECFLYSVFRTDSDLGNLVLVGDWAS
jgi:hypothetical protein